MVFELPGQLKGPECKNVMKQAIALRKKMQPWFNDLENCEYDQLAVVLRIDGTLGSFGPPDVENIKIDTRNLECDLVVEDMGWANLANDEIHELLKTRIIDAVAKCFDFTNSPLPEEKLLQLAGIAG